MKKLIAMLLCVVMVMGLAVTAFAAEGDPTITAPKNTHTYAVYQIFTGDLADGKLSNVKWGKNGTGTEGEVVPEATLTAIAAITGTAAEKAAAVAAYVDLDSTAVGTVTNGSSISVPTGYYLIKDNGPVADGEGYSLFIVEIVDSVTITPKAGNTTSEKKVKDDEGANTGWNDSADYDIGDDVPFQLKATVASDYANYTNGYKLTFHDEQSAGLDAPKNIVVKVGNTTLTKDEDYTVVTAPTDGCTFEVHFEDLTSIDAVAAGSVITVEYTSKLNSSAKIGAEGNPNTSHITYTNNPNDEQAGENGKTPDDTVIVFTYKVVVNKYANEVKDGKELAGAEFTLTKDGKTVAVAKNDAGTTFTFSGLDAGTYVLTETVTPAGYNTIDPITIVVSATHDVTAVAPKLTDMTVTPSDSFTVEMVNKAPTGTIIGNVINKAGSTLPETGGMGTTLFYVIGSLMVVGAGVLLVTKKRMSAM